MRIYDAAGRLKIAALWAAISGVPARIKEIEVLADPGELQYVGWNDTSNQLELFAFDALDIPYDNSGSGLAATDVQAAIDELEAGAVPGLETVYSGFCDAFTAAEQLPAGWTAARTGSGLITVTHSLALAGVNDLSIMAIAISNGSNDSRVQRSSLGLNSFQIQSYVSSTGGVADVDIFFIAKRNL